MHQIHCASSPSIVFSPDSTQLHPDVLSCVKRVGLHRLFKTAAYNKFPVNPRFKRRGMVPVLERVGVAVGRKITRNLF